MPGDDGLNNIGPVEAVHAIGPKYSLLRIYL